VWTDEADEKKPIVFFRPACLPFKMNV